MSHTPRTVHTLSPPHCKFFSAFRYCATGSVQLVDGDTVHLSQPTLSRIVTRVTDALANKASIFIKFPFDEASLDRIKEGFYTDRHRITNVVGVVDGSLVQIKSPSINEPAYVCRKGFRAINVRGICTNDLKYTSIVSSWPGSTHDAFIWSNCELNRKLQRGAVTDGFFLGDKAYPLRPWLLTPIRRPETNSELSYNRHHQRARQRIEATIGRWKTIWLCLSKDGGVLTLKPHLCCKVIVATAVLHNICEEHGVPVPPDEPVNDEDAQNLYDDEPLGDEDDRDGQRWRAALIREQF
ncbi:putative nuclease HARBI1 [Lineus longissimus]|uniref:putative nuclease HARBI1 n=1 Tax=Lineus longissimus TaxID=88925 RepID=UPI00315DA798